MRAYTLALLSKLTPDGTKIEDKDIINWVNNKVSYWGGNFMEEAARLAANG